MQVSAKNEATRRPPIETALLLDPFDTPKPEFLAYFVGWGFPTDDVVEHVPNWDLAEPGCHITAEPRSRAEIAVGPTMDV